MGAEWIAVAFALVVQTVILSAVNKSQIADLKDLIRTVQTSADRAHNRVDTLKDRMFDVLSRCKAGD